MSSTFGNKLKITISGTSHGPSMTMRAEGFPAGEIIDQALLQEFMVRRGAAGKRYATGRKEPDVPVFVTVGRLNWQKGYDILLEVCNLLNAENLKYEVWIIGGGEEWNHYQVLHDLEEQIRRYHLDNVYLFC